MKLLKELCELHGIPGREDAVAFYIEDRLEGICDEYFYDAMGNLHAIIKGEGRSTNKPRIMLACHMDEIGFIVNYIDEQGYVYVQPLGGFDPRNLFSRRVIINGKIKAVMNPAGLPVHMSSPEMRKQIPAADEFVLDTGLGKEALEVVSIGDMVTMDEPFIKMGNKYVSKALDNRVACYLGIKALEAVYPERMTLKSDLHVVFTVQEEVGLRGAKTATAIVKPDYSIGVDVTLSCDTPGVPANKHVTKQGEGFALGVKDASFVSSPYMVELVERVAKDHGLKYQKVVSAGGGMDGAAMQQIGEGSHAVAISVGTRYIHTVTEMVDKRDLKAAKKAIIETIFAL